MCKADAVIFLRGTGNLYDRYSEKYPDVSKEDVYGFFFDTDEDLCYLADCLKNKYSLGEMFVERRFGKLEEVITDSNYGGVDIFRPAGSNLRWKYFYKTRSESRAPVTPVFVDEVPDSKPKEMSAVQAVLLMKLLDSMQEA